MRAIMVAVDYSDILAITLPYNRHHFDRVMVVTSVADHRNVQPIADEYDAEVLATDAFWDDGASFNKWKALEQGLDVMGREGWLCLMDADVLWPKTTGLRRHRDGEWMLEIGNLYAPRRRMWDTWPQLSLAETLQMLMFKGGLPQEVDWKRFPLHRNDAEFAGYSQIFHASDPVLGPPPWHQVDWRHCGGADSFFQAKWGETPPGWTPGMPQPGSKKVRPPWECLHLGPAGKNWFGRATPRSDGTIPCGAEERLKKMEDLWQSRRRLRESGQDRFKEEKI